MLQKITLVHRSVGYSLVIICLYSKVKGMTAQGLLDKRVGTYYIHIITHIKQFFIHFEYDKVCKNDNHWPLCHATAAELPPSVTLLYLTLSIPQATQFHLLSCPLLSLLHLLVTLVKAASMKVMELNQQPIVSLCKWACAGVHCGNSYVWACVQVLYSFISRIHSWLVTFQFAVKRHFQWRKSDELKLFHLILGFVAQN